MTPDKWLEIKDKIKEKFQTLENYQEKDEEKREEKEIIIFESQMGKVKLEFRKRPVILDKKTQFSRRIGSHVEVSYVYSDDEFTYTLKTYLFNQASDDWQELKANNFNF